MKLYINYNFCGYRWFVINDVYHPVVATTTLQEWTTANNVLRILKKVMLYDSYDIAFLQEEGKYILALRHLQEQNHKDPDGRKLAMAYVFEGDIADRDLMEKLMYVYINHKVWLENALSELIFSSVDHVEYNIRSLLELLATIKGEDILSKSLRLGKGKVIALFSKWRDDTISSNLGLQTEEFVKVKYVFDDYLDTNFIHQPTITSELQQLSMEELVQKITSSVQKKEEETKTPEDVVLQPSQPKKCTFKQFIMDLKTLFKRQLTWKEFRKKYCSELRFMCMGIVVGLLIGWCF